MPGGDQSGGQTTAEIYGLMRDWFAKTVVDSGEVVENEDLERGVLLGKGLFDDQEGGAVLDRGVFGVVRYTMRVDIKEGRLRATFSDFTHRSTDDGVPSHVGLLTTAEESGMGADNVGRKWRPKHREQMKTGVLETVT